MARVLKIAICALVLDGTLRADYADRGYHSYAFGKHYIVRVSPKDLKQSPSWKKDEENPPLSARKAIKLATKMKDSLVKDSKDFKWELQSAALEPAGNDKWLWIVCYQAVFSGASVSSVPHLRLAVLMDGKVVKPEVKDRK
jgi:hypothetical protein